MTKQAEIVECWKCLGSGHINAFRHIEGGVCFTCAGTGKKEIRTQNSKPRNDEAYHQAIAIENDRKCQVAIERYANDPRLRVDINHPYIGSHVRELAEKDGIWMSL